MYGDPAERFDILERVEVKTDKKEINVFKIVWDILM